MDEIRVKLTDTYYEISERNAIQKLKELGWRSPDDICSNCKYYIELDNNPAFDGYCNNEHLGTYTTDEPKLIAFDVDKDFGCNQFKEKTSETKTI